jgi:hypothetical protein
MNRFGDDDTDAYDSDPTNAECHDCGAAWYRSEFDACVWCGPCADRRDRWATAQEMRSMAKAVLAVDLMKVKDVA